MGKTWRMVETGYRQLIVMRHAKTEQSAGSDRSRKLTSRGRADARAGGRWLLDNGFAPEVVLVSPATRALSTAEIVSAELTTGPELRTVGDLYGASASEAVEILASTEPEVASVLVVGHNPTMADLAHRLQRDPADPWAAHLPTAGQVVLQVPGRWTDLAMGSAELTHAHVPRG
jgi:phosphohistidine phosphatase